LGSDNSARNQLERLHQRGSVSAYTDQFRAVADLIPSMGDDEKRNAYTRGLKDQVHLHVAFANPRTFEETVIIATRIDDIMYHYRPRRGGSFPPLRASGGSSQNTHSNNSTPMELGAIQGSPGASTSRGQPSGGNGSARPQLTRLTDAERARLQAIGACFRCRQPGHTAMNCPLRDQQSGNGRSRQQ
jgi:hypothetical protein